MSHFSGLASINRINRDVIGIGIKVAALNMEHSQAYVFIFEALLLSINASKTIRRY